MNAAQERAAWHRYLREQARRYDRQLRLVPREEWPRAVAGLDEDAYPAEVWRSNRLLALVYCQGGHERLSVLRTELALNGRLAEGISWDDLQEAKRECGRGERWAVEVYPDDREVVNVQNMRHLWLLPDAPPYGWRTQPEEEAQG
jgi:hypothetical protein